MKLWDTLWRSLGLYGKEGRLLVLGLDNAGKTTLLYALQKGESSRPFPPTDRPTLNSFRIGSIDFTAWDLGGHEAVRHLWEDYVSETVSAVLYLIDATDSDRLEETAYELDALIAENTTLLGNIPVAILLNKCDLHDYFNGRIYLLCIRWCFGFLYGRNVLSYQSTISSVCTSS